MKKYLLLLVYALYLLSCTPPQNAEVICDEQIYRKYELEPCGFSICYPKRLDIKPSDMVVAFRIEESGESQTFQSYFNVMTNTTVNGRTIAMGDFKEYTDSSRKQLKQDIRDITFNMDQDTVCLGYDAHWFVYTGRLSYLPDTLVFTQLLINALKPDLQYVLTFAEMKGKEKTHAEIKKTLFSSFRVSKRCN